MADVTVGGIVVGAVLGLVSTLGSTTYLEHLRRVRDENGVASIFRGGVGSITRILEDRDYVQQLDECIGEIRATGTISGVFSASAKKDEYLLLLGKNIDRLGLLDPPVPALVCTFYTYLGSVIEDFESSLTDEIWSYPPAQFRDIYTELRRMIVFTIALGNEIVEALDAGYPKRPWPAAWLRKGPLMIG